MYCEWEQWTTPKEPSELNKRTKCLLIFGQLELSV